MAFSKQLFPLLFLFLLFPFQHASKNPKKCSSSFSKPLRCGPLEVPIRFPFCDHAQFNLHCNDLNKPVLELPMSGTFLVQDIDYEKQQIYIKDPENCLVRRLLTGHLSIGVRVLIIIVSIIGAIALFATCIAIRIHNSPRSVSPRQWNAHIATSTSTSTATHQPREIMVPRGLNQSTIESYQKMELGESIKLPGTNGNICTICLSEYASKETIRFIPKCNHCFHIECIDPWLKIHGSCPLCRNSRA